MMKQKLLLSVLMLALSFGFAAQEASSQFFKAYSAFTSSYPKIEMRYIARDMLGYPVSGLTAANFKIKQNGVEIPNANLNLNCYETEAFMPVNIVLLTDFTGSMNESVVGGVYRRDWVLEATRKFIDSLKLQAPGQCNIVPFSTAILPASGFTSDKADLYYWMEKSLPPFQGLTNLNYPFLNPTDNVIDMLKDKPNNIPKVVIMITDGYHEQKTDFLRQVILDKLLANNIILFTIAIDSPSDPTLFDLLDITQRTGGRGVQVSTKSDLIKFYNLVAWEIQGKRSCRLEWNTTDVCSSIDPNIEVEVELTTTNEGTLPSVFTYLQPEIGIRSLDADNNSFVLGSATTTANSRLSAKNANFIVNSVSISPENGDIAVTGLGTLPLIINKGANKDFAITYNPKAESVPTLYTVKLNTVPCETEEITVVAPCGGIAMPMATMDQTMEMKVSEKTFEIFENNTPLEVSGNVELAGVNEYDFNIKEGVGEFTLLPGEKLSVTLEFAPKSVGLKKAQINFNIDNSAICGSAMTEIEGNAIINSVEDELIAKGINIAQVSPNPTKSVAAMMINSAIPSKAKINLQNSNAQNIMNIFDGELLVGENNFAINSANLANGVYFVVISIDGKSITRKMIVNK